MQERGVTYLNERQRIEAEYQRREREISADLYAPWDAAEMHSRNTRRRVAADMLHRAAAFPAPGEPCLEIGFGTLGWLGELIGWSVRETDLHGIELDQRRAARAQQLLPAADLRVGDATQLPWPDDTFRLVVASTVFTSILDEAMRRQVAAEITRVLSPGGALLWYDFAVNNPGNPHVRRVTRGELKELFPYPDGEIRSITLAPPLARRVARRSWLLAALLEAVPFLRTHLIGVLIKTS